MKARIKPSNIIQKCKFLILCTIALCFISCSDLATGYVFEKSDGPVDYMYITMESGTSALTATSARSIVAPAIDFSDANTNDYCFYVWGKSATNSISPKKVSFDSTTSTTGTVALDFPITSYAFVLAVTENPPTELTSTAILKKAMFVGYTNADLSYSKTVKFTLSTAGLSGTGDVLLNFLLDDSWSAEQAAELVAGHYSVLAEIFNSKNELQRVMTIYSLSKTTPVSSENFGNALLPDTYDLQIEIIKDGNASLSWSYSDKLIVSPNRKIENDFLIPNVLDRPPSAPENFKVGHCMDYHFYRGSTAVGDNLENGTYNSQSGVTLMSNSQIDSYNFSGYGLIFSWTDTADTETGFKITLIDLTKISIVGTTLDEYMANLPSAMTDSDWNTLFSAYETDTSITRIFEPDTYLSSPDYIAGSLDKNSNAFIVYAQFGSCYVAKIEAENYAGTSKACYAKIDEDFSVTVTDKHSDTYASGTYTANAFSTTANPCKVINRYKIVYYMCGGTFAFTSGAVATTEKTDYKISYHTYGNTEIKCYTAQNADDGTTENPMLIFWYYGDDESLRALNNKRWKRWSYGSYKGTDLIDIIGGGLDTVDGHTYQKPDDYTGYTSLYLFARYD